MLVGSRNPVKLEVAEEAFSKYLKAILEGEFIG